MIELRLGKYVKVIIMAALDKEVPYNHEFIFLLISWSIYSTVLGDWRYTNLSDSSKSLAELGQNRVETGSTVFSKFRFLYVKRSKFQTLNLKCLAMLTTSPKV